MWLVGRYTERRARERWQALRAPLDALPRRRARAADAARLQPRRGAGGADRGGERRVPPDDDGDAAASRSSPGAMLELAATLGIALVAVVVGVRLVEGGIGFEAGLTVLVLAPELYLPLRNLAAQFHASADGLAVAERLLDLVDDDVPRQRGRRRGAEPARRRAVRLEGVSFAYPTRPATCSTASTSSSRPGETVALVGPSGAGRARSPRCSCGSRSPRRARSSSADDRSRRRATPEAWRAQIAWVPQQPTLFRGTRRRQHPARSARRRRRATCAPPRQLAGARRLRPRAAATATRRSSATAGGRSRPASGGGSRSRARSCATRRS